MYLINKAVLIDLRFSLITIFSILYSNLLLQKNKITIRFLQSTNLYIFYPFFTYNENTKK